MFTHILESGSPYITVTLPMFRAENIGWVALESLARQTHPGVPWELVIAEEQNDETFGAPRILEYYDRLYSKGCIKITYIALREWISLSEKLALLVESSDKKSEIFVFQAADYYSNPNRLYDTVKAFGNSYTYWLIPPKVLKYHIRYLDRIILVDKAKTKRRDDTIGKAIRAYFVRKAFKNIPKRRKNIDGAVTIALKKELKYFFHFTILENESWKKNLCVEGAGILSDRVVSSLFRKPHRWTGAYSVYPKVLQDIVPKDIARKLRGVYLLNKNHNKELPSGSRG